MNFEQTLQAAWVLLQESLTISICLRRLLKWWDLCTTSDIDEESFQNMGSG